MNPTLCALMGRQHGLVLRRQALSAGIEHETIVQLVRRGDWIVVRRGVYTTRERWEVLDDYVAKPLLRARAVDLIMRMPHVMSHSSAALIHGLPLIDGAERLAHITRFGALGGRTYFGVKHHKAPFTPAQLIFVDGLWVLDRARTAVDLAREGGLRAGVVACDRALRLGEDRRDLEDVVAMMPCWPYVKTARAAVAIADDGAESPGESLARLMLLELGLGPIQTQFGLRDGDRRVWCDLRVGRHVVEFDGRLKYQQAYDGRTLSPMEADQALWDEKRRGDFICGFKLGLSRLTWPDVTPSSWNRTKARLAREIADTDARFGRDVSDLASYRIAGSR